MRSVRSAIGRAERHGWRKPSPPIAKPCRNRPARACHSNGHDPDEFRRCAPNARRGSRAQCRDPSGPNRAARARGSIPARLRERRRRLLRDLPSRSPARRDARAQGRDCFGSRPNLSGTRSRRDSFKASLKAATASSSRAVPLSRSPSTLSALPRFIWVMAQSSGTRARYFPARPRDYEAQLPEARAVAQSSPGARPCLNSLHRTQALTLRRRRRRRLEGRGRLG